MSLNQEKNYKICKRLKKNDITRKRVDKVKKKLLKFLNDEKEPHKVNPEEREKMSTLKDFYKNRDEENLNLAGDIFKLHDRLLNSKNPKIIKEAIKQAEIIMKRYYLASLDEYESLFK